MPERRSNTRKVVLLEARWEGMSRRHEVRVDDVSLGGCFVNTYGSVELNEPVNLHIQLPAGPTLTLRGTVVTYQPGVGFGMSFTDLSNEARAALKELIASAADRSL